jgi:iron complex transport system ATP-binding protein
MKSAVDVHNLNFSYSAKHALRDVSFSINAGERVAVLGPNGSGKSSLLKILSGVLKPSSGKVRVLAQPIESYRRRRLSRKLAFVPQETHATFPFTVAQLVLMGRAAYLGAFALEGERDLEVARESMILTDTWNLADCYLHELSSGEKQRVVLARALAQEPKILLLDEPTTFLDVKHQIQMYELVLSLNQRRGLTVISALHDLNLASLYFPRLILLRDGAIFCSGEPHEVLTEDIIHRVYGARVQVMSDRDGKNPRVLPLPNARKERAQIIST